MLFRDENIYTLSVSVENLDQSLSLTKTIKFVPISCQNYQFTTNGTYQMTQPL